MNQKTPGPHHEKKPIVVTGLEVDPDESFTLKLNKAIDGSQGLITELIFKPMSGHACWDMPIEGCETIGQALTAAAAMTGMTPMDMKKLGDRDIRNCCNVVGGFMQRFRETS